MGICETNDTGKNIIERKRWSQPFHAPIRSTLQINNSMSFSQADIMSFKNIKSSKPTLLYKYRGSYGKKMDIQLLFQKIYIILFLILEKKILEK